MRLYLLSAVAMWEYFSYYGMRALLVLYMIKALFFTQSHAYSVYGAYGTFVYITPVIGALLAERVLGLIASILLGGFLMIVGHFLLVFSDQAWFFSALSFIIIGNGLIKPNLVKSVGHLYAKDNPERHAAFTFFYVGANVGSFLSPILCGLVAAAFGWKWGFLLAGIGMMVGLCLYMTMNAAEIKQQLPQINYRLTAYIVVGIVLVDALITALFSYNLYSYVSNVMIVAVLILLSFIWIKSDRAGRKNIMYMVVLLVLGTFFWALDQQAGSSLTVFTAQIIDRHFFSYLLPAALFQSVNPVVIIFVGPFIALLWRYLKKMQRNPSYVAKFALAIALIGLGFAVLAVASQLYIQGQTVSFWWLVLGYFLMTIGELCCEPMGLEAANTVPARNQVSLMIGLWYLCTGSYSNYLASIIAKLTSQASNTQHLQLAIADYSVFLHVAEVSVVIACVVFFVMAIKRSLVKIKLRGEVV